MTNSGTLPISIQTTNYNTSCTSSYASPLSGVVQAAASRDSSSPYSSTAVPSTGSSGVIIYSSVDAGSLKDAAKLPVNASLGASREYLSSVSERDANCTCDCQRDLVVTSGKGTVAKNHDAKKAVKSEDSVDRLVRPEMSQLAAVSTGPSLSAPCSPAKPLLRKTDAVDLEEYDYCEYRLCTVSVSIGFVQYL